jgi:hypothetical protein
VGWTHAIAPRTKDNGNASVTEGMRDIDRQSTYLYIKKPDAERNGTNRSAD